MRKKIGLLVMVTMLVATVGFVSCKKEEKSLAGTTWGFSMLGMDVMTIEFTNETDCIIKSTGESDVQGKYTYSKPDVSITVEGVTFMTGTVDGDKMNIGYAGVTFELTKK